MRILVIDGQGGGLGRSLIEALNKAFPEEEIAAAGTNTLATANMLKAGPAFAATGDNAIIYNAGQADIIAGPAGIVMANALHGEISPQAAAAITSGRAHIVLIPMNRCRAYIAGTDGKKLTEAVDDALAYIGKIIRKEM